MGIISPLIPVLYKKKEREGRSPPDLPQGKPMQLKAR